MVYAIVTVQTVVLFLVGRAKKLSPPAVERLSATIDDLDNVTPAALAIFERAPQLIDVMPSFRSRLNGATLGARNRPKVPETVRFNP